MQIKTLLAAALAASALYAQVSLAEVSEEEVVAKAVAAHPGEVTKAYKETKKGKELWEVKIKGEDGKEWEVFYDVQTGEFVEEKAED